MGRFCAKSASRVIYKCKPLQLADQSPLFPKVLGQGAITDSTYLRRVIQKCFDQAIDKLKQDGHMEEADSLG